MNKYSDDTILVSVQFLHTAFTEQEVRSWLNGHCRIIEMSSGHGSTPGKPPGVGGGGSSLMASSEEERRWRAVLQSFLDGERRLQAAPQSFPHSKRRWRAVPQSFPHGERRWRAVPQLFPHTQHCQENKWQAVDLPQCGVMTFCPFPAIFFPHILRVLSDKDKSWATDTSCPRQLLSESKCVFNSICLNLDFPDGGFSLGEAMLALPDPLLVLHVPMFHLDSPFM